ncbi:MAG: molybdenum cofactor guanylyltransferase MobA [Burkholderiales bacterium]|nr:molybdenum cofactor guanylyltransferase MobA [Burkholderiales bacterium]MDE2454812.1 molybdenum cofactor guanylyltransferase MobA [Burkholderiales bacterium]
MTRPTPESITGLVLAGGRASRMGGVDKGLQLLHGRPLALHAIERLRPQVAGLIVNANRNLEAYAALGAEVRPDSRAGFPGPLAGLLAGLEYCPTPYLASVPCDTPNFPADLVARLAAALGEAEIAMAATREEGVLRKQPVFLLLRSSLAPALAAFLDAGQRRIESWTSGRRCVTVEFDDPGAFFNANTPAELEQLQPQPGRE